MIFDPYNPIRMDDRDPLTMYRRRESEFIAASNYPDLPENNQRRQIALHRTLQYSRSENDSFMPYLAMNYFDRYISSDHFQKSVDAEEDWIENTDIIATSCLWFAWKMRKEYFNFNRFLAEKRITLKKEKIQRMDHQLLETFDGRMSSITALTFAPFLINACEPRHGLRSQTICQIVLETQDDIRFTVFRPSTISASAILTALSYLHRKHYKSYESKIMSLDYIDKDEMLRCMQLMGEMCAKKQIWMETVESDLAGRPLMRVQAGPSLPLMSLQSLSDGTLVVRPLDASFAMRPRKEPEQDEEPGPVREIQQTDQPPNMDFELKWVVDKDVVSLLGPEPYLLRLVSWSTADRCPCTVL